METNRIPTMPPDIEPEYVGAHSGLPDDRTVCEHWQGETKRDIDQCGNAATHTVVMYSGKLHEIAMCDECGEPTDVTPHEREWSA